MVKYNIQSSCYYNKRSIKSTNLIKQVSQLVYWSWILSWLFRLLNHKSVNRLRFIIIDIFTCQIPILFIYISKQIFRWNNWSLLFLKSDKIKRSAFWEKTIPTIIDFYILNWKIKLFYIKEGIWRIIFYWLIQ